MEPQRRSAGTLTGIFFLALSIILFEVALTRVFAIMMWHHFTYMVISVGLLGFGASGSVLTMQGEGLKRGDPSRALTIYSLGYALSVVLAFCFATQVRIDSVAIWKEPANLLAFLHVYLLITAPFFLGGMAIGTALTRLARDVDRLYFSDLLGSGIGAAISVWLLRSVGASASIVLAASCGAFAAFLFGLGAPRRYLVVTVPTLAGAALLAIAFVGGAPRLGIPAVTWFVPFAPEKELPTFFDPHAVDRIFSSTAEVEISNERFMEPITGGDFGAHDRLDVWARGVFQDGGAPTMLYRDAAQLERFPFLDDSQTASGYVAFGARTGAEPNVLVIGVGGGIDVMVALAHGARSVTAVEINEAMVEMVRERYDDYLGGLFRPGAHALSDRVRLIREEGRSFARRSRERYDVIQLSGVDSLTALNSGAYALSEGYLYTVEAVQELFEHLSEDGLVNYSRRILGWPGKPRETLRLANIARTALEGLGVAEPARHIAVFQGSEWASTMIRRAPFTGAELDALRAFADRQGFAGLLFDPSAPSDGELPPSPSWLFPLRPGWRGLVERWEPQLTAEEAHAMTEELLAASLASAMGEPEEAERRLAAVEARSASKDPGWMRRASLRASEQAREILEHYRWMRSAFATVIAGPSDVRDEFVRTYQYDISPSTDDSPFFFNYYRFSGLFDGEEKSRSLGDYPVGQLVLLVSMAQIVLLAAVLIFAPLRKLARESIRAPYAWRCFCYFAALGLGFMFVEITLMQKMVVFLGHPTHALSVVLAAILGFAGLGSLASGRMRVVDRRFVTWAPLVIVLVVLFDVAATRWLLPYALGWPHALRVVLALLVLFPTGFVLGWPFPSGIRLVEARSPGLLPWSWAINGFLSVFASLFSIALSMEIGFDAVLLSAAAVYVLGFVAIWPLAAKRGEAAQG